MESSKLQNMKYAELQKLAKVCGVRANMKADRLLKALQDYYSMGNLDNQPEKTLASTEVKSEPKVTKRKRSEEVIKSPKTPQTKRLKIQSTPVSKTKSLANQSHRASPVVRGTPKQETRVTATPGSQKRNHVRRGTYEKKNSPQKAAERGKKGNRSRSRDKGRHKRSSTYDKVIEDPAANERKEAESSEVIDRQGEEPSKKHKRRSTFTKEDEQEVEEAVVDGKSGGRRRSSKAGVAETSPGVQGMINAMNEDMTEAEMKASLMKELDKRAKTKVPDTVESSDGGEGSQIPRYTALGAGKGKKPTTPSGKFQSAHTKQFDKMESISQWMDRKHQRSEALGSSMKKLHMLTQQMRSAVESAKKYQTPPSLLKKGLPVGLAGKSKASLFQSPSAKPFVPTVTSVSKADFKFLKSPKPVPRSATRKSPRLSGTGRENRPANISITQAHKPKTGGTPFRFTGNTSLINKSVMNKSHNSTLNSSASVKPKFDLQASLQKPVSWRAHKGKMKPLGAYNSTSQRVKHENRQKVQSDRSDKRLDMQMKRRGFVS